MQAALPDVVQLIDTLAQAEQSAAEWASRYSEEAARVDELAKWNFALRDQIANLTSLLTACTGAQPRRPAEASSAAALVVRPPSTAALPEEAGAGPVPRWSIVRGMWHTACRAQPHRAACMLLRCQRATAASGDPELMTHGAALQGTTTDLVRKAQRRTRRSLLCFRPSIYRTTVMPSPRPPPVCMRATRSG